MLLQFIPNTATMLAYYSRNAAIVKPLLFCRYEGAVVQQRELARINGAISDVKSPERLKWIDIIVRGGGQ